MFRGLCLQNTLFYDKYETCEVQFTETGRSELAFGGFHTKNNVPNVHNYVLPRPTQAAWNRYVMVQTELYQTTYGENQMDEYLHKQIWYYIFYSTVLSLNTSSQHLLLYDHLHYVVHRHNSSVNSVLINYLYEFQQT